MASVEAVAVRHSQRLPKSKRTFSPEPVKRLTNPGKKAKTKVVKKKVKLSPVVPPPSMTPCSECGTNFTSQEKKYPGSSKKAAQASNNQTLCPSCIAKREPEKQKAVLSEMEKEKYLQEAKSFASSLVDILQDPLAQRLYCPAITSQPCACLQKFVLAKGIEESKARATLLLSMLTEAKRLSTLKCYSQSERPPKSHTIGLGNGQKRSLEFQQFVLEKRSYLRGTEVHLCERATQKVLMYSNNFLHKKLKTEPERGSRVERKKGKSALGQLLPIEDLPGQTCCFNSCVLMAQTHGSLLLQWRLRADMGQAEARRVLAEMLTPSGGGKFNCFKFIAMVTGASQSTISKVSKQMKQTGGEREPPEHGLKKWWHEQAKRPRQQQQKQSIVGDCEASSSSEDVDENPAADEQEVEEAVNRISLPEQSKSSNDTLSSPFAPVLSFAPSTEFTFKSPFGTPLFSPFGTSFIIPSHILVNEPKKPAIQPRTVELPLLAHFSNQETSVNIRMTSPLSSALQNSQVFSQVIFENNANPLPLNTGLENIILLHQPTRDSPSAHVINPTLHILEETSVNKDVVLSNQPCAPARAKTRQTDEIPHLSDGTVKDPKSTN